MICIDNKVSLKQVKERVGHKVPILGNVDSVEKLILSDKDQVADSVKQCIMDAYDSPCGYILASGCDLNGDVPLENLDAFMVTARKYGKYPVEEQNWA